MSLAWHLLQFVVILMFLVLVHEAGHMLVAKWCGMRVERFSVFFGRPLWSFQRGETEYGIGWLPLGGYVKITGMAREELVEREFDVNGRVIRETPVAPEIAARAYCNSTTPRKVATILAGPMANVVVAIIAFAISFWAGTPVFDRTNVLDAVTPGSPAAAANLQPGDRIVAINSVAATATDLTAASKELERNVGKSVTVSFVRDGVERTVTTQPLQPDRTDPTIGRIGVLFDRIRVGTDRLGPVDGFVEAFSFTGFLTKEQLVALGQIFTDKQVREQVQGPIGIGATYNDFAGEGIGTILRFAGIISLILAIMNLIPLLPLDGGHIVFALAERIRGRHLSMATYQRASIVGIGLVLILAVYAFNNDISHLTGSGYRP